jgi:hypothetical protein
MTRTGLAALAVLLLSLPLAGACAGEGAEPATEAEEEPGIGGLSPEQIRQQAEPMSPEQAEELGIIDTTIHLEKLTSPGDSALLEARPPAPRDTAS